MNFVSTNNLIFYNSINSISKLLPKDEPLSSFQNISSLIVLNTLYKNINIIDFINKFYKNNSSYFYNTKFPLTLKLDKKKYTYKSYNSNKLIITESFAILPYTKKELQFYFDSYPDDYSSLDDVIDKEFTKPYKISYSNSYINRFKEIFNLLRNKEQMDFFTSFRKAFSLMTNAKINPIIVSACKDETELNTYLQFINNINPKAILPFKIIFKVAPMEI